MLPVACFPGLFPGLEFPSLVIVTRYSELATSYMNSRASTSANCFPRFPPVTRFPALSTGYTFSCSFYQLGGSIPSFSDWLIALFVAAVIRSVIALIFFT